MENELFIYYYGIHFWPNVYINKKEKHFRQI